MTDAPDPDNGRKPSPALGAGVAIGAGVGAALFAATDNPVWIGVFAGAGVAIGAAIDRQRRSGGDDDPDE